MSETQGRQVSLHLRSGLLSAAGTALGLCLAVASPVLLTGCGSGSGNRALTSGVVNVSATRAAKVSGTWKSTRTLANGQTEETLLDFVPNKGVATVTGTYAIRVFSPRAGGGNDFVFYNTGTLTGSILSSGDLQLTFTLDGDKSVKTSRADGDNEFVFAPGDATMTSKNGNAVFNYLSNWLNVLNSFGIDGTWTGDPTKTGGFELLDPRTSAPLTPITPITIQHVLTDGLSYHKYDTSLTLTDPTTGKSYTATGVKALLYQGSNPAQTQPPTNLSSVTRLSGDEALVTASGKLPASAGALTIPGVPLTIPLAGRSFIYEASVVQGNAGKVQLGAFYLRFDQTTDPLLFALFSDFVKNNPAAGSGYILVGRFVAVRNQSTSTPTPTPSASPTPGSPAVGTIQFSNVVGANANTANITKTESSAGVSGASLTCTLTDSSYDGKPGSVERDLNMKLYRPDDASLSVGKTFQIVQSQGTSLGAGQATIQYIETNGLQKFWSGTGGTIKVIAHDSNTTTLQVVDATMTATLNAGTTQQPTGTFTINAKGKF